MSNKTQLQTNNTTLDGYIERINTAKEVAAGLPEAGSGSGSGIEYEIVTITENDTTSIPFTLKRLSKTFGVYSGESVSGGIAAGMNITTSHMDTARYAYYSSEASTGVFMGTLTIESGSISSSIRFAVPYTAIFINDPNQPAIYEEVV